MRRVETQNCFTIIEFDRDYRTVTGHERRAFESLEAAEAWCAEQSWSGYSYYVERQKGEGK